MIHMQDWLDFSLFQHPVREYLSALAVLLGYLALFIALKRLGCVYLNRLARKTDNDFDDFLVKLISDVRPAIFLILSMYLVSLHMELAALTESILRRITILAAGIQWILLLQHAAEYGVEKACLKGRTGDPAAVTLSRNIKNILKWALWGLGGLFVLDNLGVNVSALVAGLGVGGIAVAIASQAVLGDALSAFSIFIDKPFAVGDFITVEGLMGTVEHVGLKTTRLRSLGGEQIVFSNSDLTKSRIRNYKRMEVRRIAFKIGVVYQTHAAKVRKIPGMVRSICSGIEGIKLDRVHFFSYGNFSLDYEIVYYVLSPDYNVYMDKQQEINFALKDAFEKEGIEFAYPTQTVFVEKGGAS